MKPYQRALALTSLFVALFVLPLTAIATRVAMLAEDVARVSTVVATAARAPAPRPVMAAAAVGPTNPNPTALRGPLYFDVTEFGARTSSSDNGPAFQRAHDAATTAIATWVAHDGSRSPLATVFLPGAKDPYVVRTPVYGDGSFIRWKGEGAGSDHGTKIAAPITGAFPPFVVGLSRTAGAVPGSSYRPDVFGKLDTTVATATGQRRGVRTNGGLFVGSHGSPLSHGGIDPVAGTLDYWRATDCLTVDFAIEWFATPGAGIVFGAADSYYADQRPTSPPRPLLLKCNGGSFSAVVGYQATQFGPATVVSHNFTLGTTGVHKVSIQIDLAAQQICVWDNGTQVAVTGSVPSGVRFAENEHAPWFINNAADNSSNLDFALYGLCYSQNKKYANRGVTTAQVANPSISRFATTLAIVGHPTGGSFTISYQGQTTAPIAWNASAATIQSALRALSTIGAGNVTVTAGSPGLFAIAGANGFTFAAVPGMCDGSNLTGQVIPDSFRYVPSGAQQDQSDPWAVGYFAFTEPLNQRHVQITNNVAGNPGAAWLADNAAFAPATGVRFEDIEIAGAGNTGGYSTGVLLGYVLDVHFDRASISGSLYGLADMSIGANYVVYLKDCTLYGVDCGYFGYFTEVQMDSVTFPGNGRSALRMTGCVFNGRHLTVTHPGSPQYAIASLYDAQYGGSYEFDDVSIDSEGDALLRAGIYCERHNATQTSLTINNMYFGTTGSVPLIKLANRLDQTAWSPSILRTNLVNANGTGPIVEVDGDGWVGEVRNSFTVANSDLNYTGTSGRPRIRVINDFGYKLPHKYGSDYLGVSRSPNLGPADGQYDEIRVALDGTWGTASPATWKGYQPSQSDPSATLAAYALDHTIVAATLSGQVSSSGYLTAYGDVQSGLILFGGTPPTMPATWYVGLSTADATKAGAMAEVQGVSRVALANSSSGFTAASSGTKASAAAVTFGAMPTTQTIRSIFIIENATVTPNEAPVVVVQLAQPITFAAGATPTINSGAITFAHLPLTGDFRGTLTDYGWGKQFDLMFRGTSFTAPTSYYAALSTAALTKSSTSPTEPSGNGYARVAVANDASHWNVYPAANWRAGQPGDVANLAAITFPTATGSWASCPYGGLMDASSGGNLWWAFPLVSPVSPTSGSVPSFAVGALFLGL